MFTWFSFLVLVVEISLLIRVSLCSSPDEWFYQTCNTTFSCGSITNIGYPFIGNGAPEYCGYPGFVLNCDDQTNTTTIEMMNVTYVVLDIDQSSQILNIVRKDVIGSICPQDLVNTTIDQELFEYSEGYTNLTFLYGCPSNLPGYSPFSCPSNGYNSVYVLPGADGPQGCNVSVLVPVTRAEAEGGITNTTGLYLSLQQGFAVKWTLSSTSCNDCIQSSGRCGYDYATTQTACYCPNPPYISTTCSTANSTVNRSSGKSSGKKSSILIVAPVIGGVVASIAIGWLILFYVQRKRRPAAVSDGRQFKDLPSSLAGNELATTPSYFTESIPSYPFSKTEFGRSTSTYFGVHVFKYSELVVATSNFHQSRELGEGGFGTVYYGKLGDGREVAVKRLYENNFKRVEQFMNEVEILANLDHEHLVKLYGCTSKSCPELLLVYEYIPNGTIADHLNGKQEATISCLLSWPVRLNIAIETAEALAYLHASDIIHRDVKTNNILLDRNFHVKVADFGLSRLFDKNFTHVSTAPQGTPGYVDPEYYQCYKLTDKSDVYSFGVVLVELISSLEAVDTNRLRHDINLSSMAVNKIQNHLLHELVDTNLGFDTDGLVRRKITLVAELAFRCLQQERDMRPSMKEVLETLREIQNEESNAQKAEVLDIVVDDSKDNNPSPSSPESNVALISSVVPNSSG